MMEAFIGHLTFAAMMNRSSLSCFSAVYAFSRAHYGEEVAIWPAARAELVAFKGLLPLLETSSDAPWSDYVTQSDASDSGWGICTSRWPVESVASVGRVRERDRWKAKRFVAPRVAALGADSAACGALDADDWGVPVAAAPTHPRRWW